MADPIPVHFFDIESTLPRDLKPWSPNTIKTRMVLNYKRIPYTQSYISYPDIAPLLSNLNVPPHEEGVAYTLPTICHPPTVISNPNGALMDSFAIATHLDQAFPSPPLFPSRDASYALALAVNKLITNVVSKCSALIMPRVADFLDPRGREYFIKTRSARFGKPLSEVLPKETDQIQMIIDAAKAEMAPLAQMLRGRLGKNGPFLEGETPGYADFLIVALLVWCERGDKMLWKALLNVGEGEVKALWDVCLPWVNGQGEDKDWEILR
ncbi:hypothetical protein EYZ11_010355 [Aspergillus tanneri]|uniref:Uncharacterized protein n=1 Tax=Aspergillus tanneri TaxID=1220188 RepID=A0A4S3J7N5_9EURO|nr:uncharacterized protein ATNIH1004_009543 [Aspergillus tanneri]KAA8642791.1 hypothetical protein ATNIH1004_009543 [Aspergillus tanneri]THC90178.1 hypothetical protein EYZ11_010355 [Aspergillus tanneri]